MPTFVPRVVDISHHNVGPLAGRQIDFQKVADSDIWGVICKASEGTSYTDPTYKARRPLIKAAKLLHGAYHFNTGENVKAQVDRFFFSAQPDDTTLMALDYEHQPRASKGQMSIQQFVEFLRLGEEKLSRKLKIYSGNFLKERIGKLGPQDKAYVQQHDLWLAQYSAKPVLPPGFSKFWLWQFTGDALGPNKPTTVPGITARGIDLNAFNGTREELTSSWAGGKKGGNKESKNEAVS